MRVVQPVGNGDMHVVPSLIAGFAAADQQDRTAARIERVKNAVRAAFMLDAQLAQVIVSEAVNPRRVRKTKLRSIRFEQPDRCGACLLFGFGHCLPPRAELVGVFHFPFALHPASRLKLCL